MRACLLATILCLAACGDDTAAAPDGGTDASTPSTVWEHLVAGGDWIQDFRQRDLGCTGCRTVLRFELVPDDECGCMQLVLHAYWDVVATDDAMGLADGDEQCHQVFEMTEQLVDGINPSIRSLVHGTLTSSTCPGGGVGGMLDLIFDAQQIDAGGRPEVIALVQPGPAGAFVHVAGYPTDPADVQHAALPLVRCAEADRVDGRDYCMPSCDWPGADAGRPECGFPAYVDPPFHDLGCLGAPHEPTAPDPLTLTGNVKAFSADTAIVGATVEAHLVSDDALLATATTAAGGTFTLPYATGGVAIDTYVKTTAAGYRDNYDFTFEPLIGDASIYPRLFTAAETGAFAAAAGTTLTAGTGALVLVVNDCAWSRLADAVITVPGAPGATVVYIDADGAPDLSRSSTGAGGTAVILNLPPGPVDTSIVIDGVTFGSRPAGAFADGTTTQFRLP